MYQYGPGKTIMLAAKPSDPVSTCLWQENLNRPVNGWSGAMADAARRYTAGQIDRAGKVLSSPTATKQESDEAIAVMDSWRVAHNRPLEMARAAL